VTRHGPRNLNVGQKNTGLARRKSWRLRWTHNLRPNLRRGAFSKQEQRNALMGNERAKMAQELPGRTENEIKNF